MINWISDIWFQDEYQNLKKENFEILDSYLETKPLKILDIGCGLAWESRLFNQKYHSELWLMDGDSTNNDKKNPAAKDKNYSNDINDFLYYYSLRTLDEQLKQLRTENYRLVDCNNIEISSDIKFDLITSWVSCGFHYPANTYKELIKKHSHSETKIIFDLRIMHKKQEFQFLPTIQN